MPNHGQRITILVAEDDADDRDMIRDAWAEGRLDPDLRFVKDGEELLDYLHHRGAYKDVSVSHRPSMILLDLNMPKKDGREALREIKADPLLRQIPVVVLTTSKAEEDICRTYELGGNSFIIKPVAFKDLVDMLTKLGCYWFQVVELPGLPHAVQND